MHVLDAWSLRVEGRVLVRNEVPWSLSKDQRGCQSPRLKLCKAAQGGSCRAQFDLDARGFDHGGGGGAGRQYLFQYDIQVHKTLWPSLIQYRMQWYNKKERGRKRKKGGLVTLRRKCALAQASPFPLRCRVRCRRYCMYNSPIPNPSLHNTSLKNIDDVSHLVESININS